jgi:hypothetical protein
VLRAILAPSSAGGTFFYLAKGQGVENDRRRDDYGLNREEQETIINFNKGEKLASIFTYDRRWQRRK